MSHLFLGDNTEELSQFEGAIEFLEGIDKLINESPGPHGIH